MRIFKLAILANYLFWGGMATYALGELVLKNEWLELFTIERTTPTNISVNKIEEETIELRYTILVNDLIYEGTRRVYKPLADERLPTTPEQIEISYNSLLPQVNWIDELGLKARTGYVGLTLSGIFLSFVILVDILANKQKWVNRYKKALNG